MANKTINDYASALTIDASNDYFLLEQGSVYKRINRAVMLNITGSPVGTSDTQNLTNKTLDNTNVTTLKDSNFTLQNAADVTKQVKFSLTGVTTGTTRTITLPNASSTLATLTGTETLTNKTITAPAITGGTIDNSTITVDSISGHTTAGTVTVGGVQMASGVINTSGAVVTASIAAGAVVPNSLLASTGTGWTWQTYVPTWTASSSNPAIGNGTIQGVYCQVGKIVTFYVKVVAGSTTGFGSGTYSFGLPVTGNAIYSFAAVGSAMINHVATTTAYMAIPFVQSSATVCNLRITSDSSLVTNTAPATFAQGDTFSVSGTYQVA